MTASQTGPPVHWPTCSILAVGFVAALFAHHSDLRLQACLGIFTAFGLVALGWYWYAASWQPYAARWDWTGAYALVSGVLLSLLGGYLLAKGFMPIPFFALAAAFLVYSFLRWRYARKFRRF